MIIQFSEDTLSTVFVGGSQKWLQKNLVMTVFHLFHIENFVNFVYFSYIRGYKLIVHLSNVAILNNDNDNRQAIKSILFILIFFIGIGIINFSLGVLWNKIPVLICFKGTIFNTAFQFLFMSNQYQTVIYYYCMITYKRQIQIIQSKYFQSSK